MLVSKINSNYSISQVHVSHIKLVGLGFYSCIGDNNEKNKVAPSKTTRNTCENYK